MNLYGILGVRRNASAETIRKAYRAKAKDAHPDAGGTEDGFHAVSLAYRVLSDPDARARYDQTGEVKAPGANNDRARALSHLDKAMVALMMSDDAVYGGDVIDKLQDHLTEEVDAFDGAVQKLTRAKKRLLVLRERLRPTGKERALEALIAQQLREVEGEIEIKSEEVRTRLMAWEILNAYEFDAEEGGNPQEVRQGAETLNFGAGGFAFRTPRRA